MSHYKHLKADGFSLPNAIPSAASDAIPAGGTELLPANKHIASLFSFSLHSSATLCERAIVSDFGIITSF